MNMARPEGFEPPTFWFVERFSFCGTRVFKWMECAAESEMRVFGLRWEAFVQRCATGF